MTRWKLPYSNFIMKPIIRHNDTIIIPMFSILDPDFLYFTDIIIQVSYIDHYARSWFVSPSESKAQ